MIGKVDSLNVSVATSIMIYEVLRLVLAIVVPMVLNINLLRITMTYNLLKISK